MRSYQHPDEHRLSEGTKRGVTFLELLLLLFIALKLLGKITWSWWWVLSPMWIPVLLALIILVVALVWMGVAYLIQEGEKGGGPG